MIPYVFQETYYSFQCPKNVLFIIFLLFLPPLKFTTLALANLALTVLCMPIDTSTFQCC